MASRQNPIRNVPTPGSREFQFYVSKAPAINRRFAGKHVAIIGDQVVASGQSPLEVWERANKSHPKSRPLLAHVPKRDTVVLTAGNQQQRAFGPKTLGSERI